MFTHQQNFDHFQLHTFSDNNGTLLEIVPERGGIVSRFEVNHRPIFFLDRDSLNDTSKNVRGGNPVLFPICGPLADGKTEINGQSYSMKQHGFARNLPWAVVGSETGADSASITLRLESNDTTREQFPFDFCVDYTYRLTPNSLKIEQRYENRSAQPMPFYAGFHPYFTAAEKNAVDLKVAATQLDDFISKQWRDAEPVINFDAAPETNGAYHNVGGNSVRFANLGAPYAVEIEFAAPFRHVVIWALKDKPFICVEPWMGLNNSLNTGDSVYHLAAGESLETYVTFKVQ